MLKLLFILSILVSDIALGCVSFTTPTSFLCVKVLYVIDGDTMKVDIKGVPPLLGVGILVRTNGVDAPEIHAKRLCEKKDAERAKKFTEDLIANATQIDLIDIKRDKYFRILAKVEVDGVSLGQKLISAKLAVPYAGETKQKWDCQ